jgi:hypothetical protein
MRDWLRRWLGVESAEQLARATSIAYIGISDRMDRHDADIIALMGTVTDLRDRITAIETSSKSAPTPEKKTGGRPTGWNSVKRALQKDSEWGH